MKDQLTNIRKKDVLNHLKESRNRRKRLRKMPDPIPERFFKLPINKKFTLFILQIPAFVSDFFILHLPYSRGLLTLVFFIICKKYTSNFYTPVYQELSFVVSLTALIKNANLQLFLAIPYRRDLRVGS